MNLSVVDRFFVSFIIKEHHVDKDEEDAAVTLRTHAPLEEDKEDEITEERQQENNFRNEAQQDVLDISEMAGHKDEKKKSVQECGSDENTPNELHKYAHVVDYAEGQTEGHVTNSNYN